MSKLPMRGIKVVEVAQFTFTPSAGGVLADWGAEVIKVEHAVTGDAQRGLRHHPKEGSFHPLMDHPNRGKRSMGLALEVPEGRAVLLELVRDADVFLTNFLPAARTRLGIDLEDIRTANPKIIYVRGSAHGQRGPDAEAGGFDGVTFWNRQGSAWGVTPLDSLRPLGMPSGAYGDSMGGMTIAGGIAAALFARERHGEPSVVDVSLMSVGAWAMGLALNNAILTNQATPPPPIEEQTVPLNPIRGTFKTSDGRWICLAMLQPGRYWADACRHLGLVHLIDDPRFASTEGLTANAMEGAALVAAAVGAKPFAYWTEHLKTMEGQWSAVQNPLEIVNDPQMYANGYILPLTDHEGNERKLIASPVQFDETPPTIGRGPLFAEHTDDILRELGKTDREISQLKIVGACS